MSVVATAPPSQAAPSSIVQNGRIMVAAPIGGGMDSLLTVDEAGRGSSLTSGTLASGDFSEDGRYVVVSRNGKIRAADADGRASSGDLADGERPRFSPNNSKILYWANIDREAGTGDLWVMNADATGSGKVQVATGASFYTGGDTALAVDPQWSPSGNRILYEGGGQIRLVNPDGTAPATIASGGSPDWRPDGNKIAYAGGTGIRTVNPNGTGDAAVAGAGDGAVPKWSPDGTKIMFKKADGPGSVGVYTIPAAGGAAVRVAAGLLDTLSERYLWSPDAGSFVFTAFDGKFYNLYAANIDGTEATRIVQAAMPRIDDWQKLTVAPSKFVGITPKRFLDTRELAGDARLAGGSFLTLKIAGRAAPLNVVPADATSVVLNVTGVQSSGITYMTVWPSGQPLPLASNLNLSPGESAPNLVTVRLGKDGSVNVYNNSGFVHVIVDVVGYYTATPSASGFKAMTPKRLLDTRPESAVGGHSGKFSEEETFDLEVAGGTTTVPSNATGVVLNVTAFDAVGGFITLWPKGSALPDVSNLNPVPGQVRPNLVAVKVGSDRSVSIFNRLGESHILVDVVGYFTTADATATLFVPTNPWRLYDSREVAMPLGPPNGPTVTIDVDGEGPIQPGAKALVVNAAVTQPTANVFLSVYPTDAGFQGTSNLNFFPGQTVPNLVYTGLSPQGEFTAYSPAGTSHVVFDAAGYFIAP